MIPIKDENPSGTFPFVTLILVAGNIGAFVTQMSVPEAGREEILSTYALVPAQVWWSSSRAAVDNLRALLPVFSSMFMHGGVMHLIGNMWFLWLFGDNVEDRVGHTSFVFFYLICGIAAAAAHLAFVGGTSEIPMVGASGAIAGVLGAYLVCFPRARVLTVIPIFIFIQFVRLPAFVFLALWFALQMLGAVAAAAEADGPGVAWLAHVGGFAAGAALILFWPRNRRSHQAKYQATPDVWRARAKAGA